MNETLSFLYYPPFKKWQVNGTGIKDILGPEKVNAR